MMRLPGWETRLYGVLERAWTGMKWGELDCALLVADAIEAQTGVDLATEYRGRYNTAREALALCRAAGGLHELIIRHLGKPLVGSRANRGDPVAVGHRTFGTAMGVCDGRMGVFLAPAGIQLVPRSEFLWSWPLVDIDA